ncbi:MAG: ATP-dependent DNA helicase [Ignavibacteriales bacterium]
MRLTDEQIEAIGFRGPALQIVACAGSGKTEVLSRRVANLLLKGIPPDGIIAFTFTEKAAEELKQRIDARAAEADPRFVSLPPSSAGVFVGTIHSYCLNLLRDSGAHEIHDVLNEEREWALLYRFARRLGLMDLMEASFPGRKTWRRGAVNTFVRNISAVYSEAIPRDQLGRHAPLFAQAVERYESLTAAMRLLSFDRIIQLAADAVVPGTAVYRSLAGRVREVLVDEYQDLNKAQEVLLRRLRDLGANVTVVGDDDQAIYQWRGGDVSLFVGFMDRHGGARKQLGENHRSVRAIVDLASEFAGTIRGRIPKEMRSSRHDSAEPALAQPDSAHSALVQPTHSASAPGRPAVEIFHALDAHEEARLVADRIRSLIALGHNPHDIAVLFRSVRTSAGPIVDALKAAGIPADITGRVSLLDRPEMALIARIFVWWSRGVWKPDRRDERVTPDLLVSGIRELTGCTENEAAAAVASVESLGALVIEQGVPDLQQLYMDILRTVGLPSVGLPSASTVEAAGGGAIETAGVAPGGAESGAAAEARSRQERALGAMSGLLVDFEHSVRRWAPPGWFRQVDARAGEEVAEESIIQAGPTESPGRVPRGAVYLAWLVAFLEEHASQAAEERVEGAVPTRGAVNIMTVHQAKGLEFPIVFLPSLTNDRFPSSMTGRRQDWFISHDFPRELFDRERYEGRLDDERRLFYVAMTRAKDLLVMSFFLEDERGNTEPSVFLRDLGGMQCRSRLKKLGECCPAVLARSTGDAGTLAVDCTQLLVYGECPYRYYLKNVCGFAGPIAPELGFGRALHHTVADLARRAMEGRSLDQAVASSVLEESFYLPFAGRTQRERLFGVARSRIAGFVRRHAADIARAVGVERRFEIPFDGARLRGRIDLLLKPASSPDAGCVEVVDVKTAENRPPLLQHRNQLRLYAAAMRATGMKPVGMFIYDLDSGGLDPGDAGILPVEEDSVEYAGFQSQVVGWLDGIRRGDFRRTKGGWCRSCDYRGLCDAVCAMR